MICMLIFILLHPWNIYSLLLFIQCQGRLKWCFLKWHSVVCLLWTQDPWLWVSGLDTPVKILLLHSSKRASYIAQGHRQQCGDGQGGVVAGKLEGMEDICISVNKTSTRQWAINSLLKCNIHSQQWRIMQIQMVRGSFTTQIFWVLPLCEVLC